MSSDMEKRSPDVVLGSAASRPAEEHTSTMIFLHDLGGNGFKWRTTLALLVPPGMRIVCPTAPVIDVSMRTISRYPRVNAWFDLKSLDITGPVDEEGIKASTQLVHKLIDEQIALGIPSNRIVLGGYSQGGALALFAGLTCDKPLGGIVALSCWLPMHEQFPGLQKVPNDLPIFIGHGIYDLVVLHKYGQISADHMKTFMTNITFKTYDFLSHTTCEQELADIKAALEKWMK